MKTYLICISLFFFSAASYSTQLDDSDLTLEPTDSIDSELADGSLTYGELIINGESKKEVFLSTYVCHPSMANNELSGPTVTTYLAKWIQSQPRKYTYRIIFIPETIGSICYLSRNLNTMKENIVAGFNISCVGDDDAYSYLPSRAENTISDKIHIGRSRNDLDATISKIIIKCHAQYYILCSWGLGAYHFNIILGNIWTRDMFLQHNERPRGIRSNEQNGRRYYNYYGKETHAISI